MQNGFLVAFPSSTGETCFLVTPRRVGQPSHPWFPWARATFVGTLFTTQVEAESALKRMRDIHGYIAPELNGGLFKRLALAKVVPAAGLRDVEFEIL